MLELTTHFRYTTAPLEVVSVSPSAGSTIAAGQPLDLVVTFNRPVDPASIGLDDLVLTQGTIVNAHLMNPQTVDYSITGVDAEGTLGISMPAVAVRDTQQAAVTPYAANFDVDIDQIAVHPFTRVAPLGSLVYASTDNAGSLESSADVDTFTFDLSAGDTVSAVITPDDPGAVLTLQVPGLGGTIQSSLFATALTLGQAPASGTYSLVVSGSKATTYTVSVYLNAAASIVGLPAEPLDGSAIAFDTSVRYAAVGDVKYDPLAAQYTQDFTLDLTGSTGQKIDVAMTDFDGISQPGQTLQLLDDQASLLATGTPQGSVFDQAILGFTVPHDGVYTFRVTLPSWGTRYSLVVTRAMELETEPNDNSGDALRIVPPYSSALGYVGLPPVEGTYQLQVDPNQTTMVLTSNLSSPPGQPPLEIPLTEQAAGSLAAQIAGALTVRVDDSGIQFVSGSLDPIANPGPFQPSSQPADFAGQFNLGISVYAALRNLLFRVDSAPLAWTGNGTFDASQVSVLFTDGDVSYDLAGNVGSFPVANPDNGNLVMDPGQWEVLPGQIRLTLPFHMTVSVTEPTTGLIAEIDLASQIVATAALPVADADLYHVAVGSGELQQLDISLTPLSPSVDGPENTLQPLVLLLDPLGNIVESQLAFLPGQPINIMHPFSTGGTYTIVVTAAEGAGEYLLKVGGWVNTVSQIAGRQIFYNQSKYDGDSPAVGASDDDAIAIDKVPYFPGDGVATGSNATSYSRGINGIMVDLEGVHGDIAADDFEFKMGKTNSPDTWTTAPAPSAVVTRTGAGVGGSDRVEILWSSGAIANTWLQVAVRGNDALGAFDKNTGLPQSDVFYFGNLVGDSFFDSPPLVFTTNVSDEIGVRNHYNFLQPITNVYDFNKDSLVNVADELLVRANYRFLARLNLPAPSAAAAAASVASEDAGRQAVAIALVANAPAAAPPRREDISWLPPRQVVVPLPKAAVLPPTNTARLTRLAVEPDLVASDALTEELLEALLSRRRSG